MTNEHHTTVRRSGGDEADCGHGGPLTPMWYFACDCGMCGRLRRFRAVAEADGALHERGDWPTRVVD